MLHITVRLLTARAAFIISSVRSSVTHLPIFAFLQVWSLSLPSPFISIFITIIIIAPPTTITSPPVCSSLILSTACVCFHTADVSTPFSSLNPSRVPISRIHIPLPPPFLVSFWFGCDCHYRHFSLIFAAIMIIATTTTITSPPFVHPSS